MDLSGRLSPPPSGNFYEVPNPYYSGSIRVQCTPLADGSHQVHQMKDLKVGTAGSSLDIIVRRVDDVVKRKMQMKMNLRGEDE
jgi:hypothetical protein